MGIIQSSPGEIEDLSKIKDNLNDLLNFLLSQHMNNFLDKSFCKKTKLFIRDNLFMKHAEDDIKILSDEIVIGKEITDLSEKTDICDKLAGYYLKKVNLVSSINHVIGIAEKNLEYIQKWLLTSSKNRKSYYWLMI